MYKCDCGRCVFEIFELSGKKYCALCAPRCQCCDEPIRAGVYYVKTEWGIVCPNCFNPALICFTCGIQLKAGNELRLADHRVSCAACAATAVYRVDKDFVCAVKRRLAWFPRKHITFGTVDVRKLHEMRPVKSGTILGMCNTITMQVLTYVSVVRHQIWILFGLPRAMCEASLVHELFHAWIHENVPPGRYSEPEMEWLCENMAFKYLRAVKAQDHWLKRIESSRDQYPEVPGLKSHGQETIVRFLKR